MIDICGYYKKRRQDIKGIKKSILDTQTFYYFYSIQLNKLDIAYVMCVLINQLTPVRIFNFVYDLINNEKNVMQRTCNLQQKKKGGNKIGDTNSACSKNIFLLFSFTYFVLISYLKVKKLRWNLL